jgi:predicted nucleotidyltransferase
VIIVVLLELFIYCQFLPTTMTATLQGFDTKEITQTVRKRLQNYAEERFVRLVVFGSVARGDARQDSDIDMMLFVSHTLPTDKEVISDICSDILLEYGIVLSLFCRTEAEFAQRPFNPLFRNILREGVAV